MAASVIASLRGVDAFYSTAIIRGIRFSMCFLRVIAVPLSCLPRGLVEAFAVSALKIGEISGSFRRGAGNIILHMIGICSS